MGSQTSANFAKSEQADLLDLVAKRYPGTKPSDYYGELDDYSAFQLDAAIALKGKIRDQEHEMDIVHLLLEGMVGIMRSQGARPKKLHKPEKIVFEDKEEDDLPHVNELLQALGGVGTVNG